MDDQNPKPIELYEHFRATARQELETEIVTRLLEKGFEKHYISEVTGVPIQTITNVVNVRFSGRTRSPEEEEIAADARRLVKKAMARADMILDVGTHSSQISIIKALLPAAARLVGNDISTEDEALAALQRVFGDQRLDGMTPELRTGRGLSVGRVLDVGLTDEE